MTEKFKADMAFPGQSPDIALLVARGRALRNRMICESCAKILVRLKKSIGF